MYLTKTQKELISRIAMAVVALAFLAAATGLLVAMIFMGSIELGRFLIPVIVLLYVIGVVFACFVFTAWDPRRANLARTMVIGDKISDGVSQMFRIDGDSER